MARGGGHRPRLVICKSSLREFHFDEPTMPRRGKFPAAALVSGLPRHKSYPPVNDRFPVSCFPRQHASPLLERDIIIFQTFVVHRVVRTRLPSLLGMALAFPTQDHGPGPLARSERSTMMDTRTEQESGSLLPALWEVRAVPGRRSGAGVAPKPEEFRDRVAATQWTPGYRQ
jgi:hypothetical protein